MRLQSTTSVRVSLGILLLALTGCVSTSSAPMQGAYAQLQQQRSAQQCPRGMMKVCDRRRGTLCRCSSPRHVKAMIGSR